jgi:autotransporter-associated beta strand protein
MQNQTVRHYTVLRTTLALATLAGVLRAENFKAPLTGAYSAPASWVEGTVPDGVDAIAELQNNTNQSSTTDLDQSPTLGRIGNTRGNQSWTWRNPDGHTITMQVSSGTAIVESLGRNNLTLPADIVANSDLRFAKSMGTGGETRSLIHSGTITGAADISLENSITGGTGNLTVGTLNNAGTVTVTGTMGGTAGTTTLGRLGPNVTALTRTAGTTPLQLNGFLEGFSAPLNVTAGQLSFAGDYTVKSADTLSPSTLRASTGATLTLPAAAAASVADGTPLTLSRAEFLATGNLAKTLGTLTSDTAFNRMKLDPSGGGNATALTFDTLAGIPVSAAMLFRGANLGATPGEGNANIFFTTTPTLTGGGTDSGTTKRIIRHAIGDTSADGTGSGFVTYDGTLGVRLLTSGEYSSSLAANANVLLTANASNGSALTVNSLRLAGGVTLSGTGGLTLSSGDIHSFGASANTISATMPNGAYAFFVDRQLSVSGNINNSTVHKYGDATLILTLQNALAAGSTINAGTLQINSANDRLNSTTIQSGAKLFLNSNNAIADAATITVNAGGVFDIGSRSDTIGNLGGSGEVTSSAATGTLTVNNAGSINIDNPLTGTLNFAQRGTGASIFTMTRQNTYTGTTTIQSGEIRLGVEASLPVTTTLRFSDGSNTGWLNLNGYDQQVAALANVVGTLSGMVRTKTGTPTFTVEGAADSTFRGAFIGPLTLVKAGAGTLTLGELSNHSRGTRVEGGVLNVTATGRSTVSSIAGTASSGANTVTVASTEGLRVGQVVGGTNIRADSYISEIISGTQFRLSFTTSAAISSGTLTLSTLAGALGSGDVTVADSGTLRISGELLGAGTITVENGGTLDGAGKIARRLGAASGEQIVVENGGAFDATAMTLALDFTVAEPEVESFVVVDHAAGTFTGPFAATSGLPEGWQVVYTPTSVVAQSVGAATVILIR